MGRRNAPDRCEKGAGKERGNGERGGNRGRTGDLRLMSPPLCQLSYPARIKSRVGLYGKGAALSNPLIEFGRGQLMGACRGDCGSANWMVVPSAPVACHTIFSEAVWGKASSNSLLVSCTAMLSLRSKAMISASQLST